MTAADELIGRPGLWQFLKTKRSVEELKTALAVIEEFKDCESEREWLALPFAMWTKLEQLEDYLRLVTGEGAEEVKDETAIHLWQAIRSVNDPETRA